MTFVEMQINIDCDGCEGNVRKALLRLRGVQYVDVDRLRGKVTVTGTAVSQKKVLRAARRTGRLAVLWPSSAHNNSEYHHAYAYAHVQPAHHHHYQAAANKPATAHHYYNIAGGGSSASALAMAQYGKVSSYNYHVHGYYDSDLHGGGASYHEQHNVVPVAARSYFSDDNPNACSIV